MSEGADTRPFPSEGSGEIGHGFLSRRAGRPAALLLALMILSAPYWLFSDLLQGFALQPTDFLYIQESRDAPALRQHLMAPLNTHVVPLFRLWTYALVRTAGCLEELPRVLLAASYLSLIVTMVLVGLLVVCETGRTEIALASMACLGISTVVLPALNHYAAGQALWAAAAVVATLLAATRWRANGGAWRLGLAAAGVIAAPAVWTGGLTAGPAVAAALWVDGRARCRRAALAIVVATCAAAAAILWMSRNYIHQTPMVWEQHHELWPRPVQAVLHTCQAIAEGLLLNNLGLDAQSSPLQATVLVACLAGLWYASRGRSSRATPLEAAGAVVIVASGLMTYFFRGNLPFASVRSVGWYYLMPQVGAVLLAAGWWAGLARGAPRDRHGLTWGGVLAVVAVVLALLSVQSVRAERILIEAAPPLAPSEVTRFPTPELKRARAIYLIDEFAQRQRRMLARLDRVEQIARREGIGPAAIRRAFGRVFVTGMPARPEPYDAAGLLSLPRGEANLSRSLVHSALADYYFQEKAPRPPWLPKSDPWPGE
jgi:hypothetical protein